MKTLLPITLPLLLGCVLQSSAAQTQPHIVLVVADGMGFQDCGASVDPDKARKLQALWDAWNADNEPPRWIDNRWNGDGPGARKAAAKNKKRQP